MTDEKIDDDFLVVAAHVDPTTCDKIVKGEYVDFAKLIPRDRIASEDNHRMEMVNRGGHSYWVPVADREKTDINSIFRWDQAFRVFSNIYSRCHPHRAAELLEYSHVVHELAYTYI